MKSSPTPCYGRIDACRIRRLANVYMMADSKALEGKDLGLVADYMALLTLSEPKSLDGCNSLPSVIDVYAKTACHGRDAPDGLTPADAAYLTALYSTQLEYQQNFEQSDIARRMADILIKADAVPRTGTGSPPSSPR